MAVGDHDDRLPRSFELLFTKIEVKLSTLVEHVHTSILAISHIDVAGTVYGNLFRVKLMSIFLIPAWSGKKQVPLHVRSPLSIWMR